MWKRARGVVLWLIAIDVVVTVVFWGTVVGLANDQAPWVPDWARQHMVETISRVGLSLPPL